VVLHRGGGGEEAQLNSTQRKSGKGGRCSGSAHRGGFRDGGGGRTAAVARSGRGMALGRRRGGLRAWEVARSGRRVRDEARRGGVGSVVAFSDTTDWKRPVRTTFNLLGAFGHRRPWQPIRARCEATLPLTARPHSSAFSILKITPGQK
jgi:hypothetical protein